MRGCRLVFVVCLAACLLCAPAGVRAELSFHGIPAARDVASSRALLEERRERVIAYWSAKRGRPFPSEVSVPGFSYVALAKLQRDSEITGINRALLAPSAQPYAAYGTRMTVIPGLCARAGDYDFMAQELVRLAYTHLDHPLRLWPVTANKIAWKLLPAAGAHHQENFRLGLCGRHRDTENHILMTESSRYLTNQLRHQLGSIAPDYDNAKNGFDAWLLSHLGGFLRHHFEEYNARPYQGYTVKALANLYSYASNRGVARAAGMVLDYLSAVFAVQSNGLRRNPPFRRQAQYADTPFATDHDPETARFALLAGNYPYVEKLGGRVDYGAHFMLAAAVGRYRVPEPILDLIVRKDQGAYFQRFHHRGVELYASSASFLLSAGGVFVRNFAFGSTEQHGWARATSVIATRDRGTDTRGWLRIRGNDRPRLRNNSCVAPNFACGLNVEIPASLPARCRERHGAFELIDLSAPRCPLGLGFYVAARVARCEGAHCDGQAENIGAFELREASELPFERFRELVLRNNRNATLRSDGPSTYVTTDGRAITFDVFSDRALWPIVSIAGRPQQRRFADWPLASGDVIHAAGDGLVTVDNRALGERLVLDMRDPLRPVRRSERLAPRVAAASPGASPKAPDAPACAQPPLK